MNKSEQFQMVKDLIEQLNPQDKKNKDMLMAIAKGIYMDDGAIPHDVIEYIDEYIREGKLHRTKNTNKRSSRTMASKNFENINLNNQVTRAIERATGKTGQQGTASQEEAQERKEELRTQGRKGAKAIRINMAFTPSNHEFIRIVSRIKGMSMTEYTNDVIKKYREEHPELLAKAKALIEEEEGSR